MHNVVLTLKPSTILHLIWLTKYGIIFGGMVVGLLVVIIFSITYK